MLKNAVKPLEVYKEPGFEGCEVIARFLHAHQSVCSHRNPGRGKEMQYFWLLVTHRFDPSSALRCCTVPFPTNTPMHALFVVSATDVSTSAH